MGELSKNSNFAILKGHINSPEIKNKFKEILGKRAAAFTSSVLTAVSSSEMLKNADTNSILMSALVAATLDLPINPSLGFAAIVPYRDREFGTVAQFQIMTKGLVQLAERSGQYKRINNAVVYEGQLVKEDPFTGEYEFDFYAKKSDKVIGYMAYMKLNNGFEKYFYMTKEEVEAHAKKYSKVYQKGYGVWRDDFDKMALKTVLKLMLSRYGILSIEMQNAIEYDQAILRSDTEDLEDAEIIHPDNASDMSLTDKLAERYYDVEDAEEVTSNPDPEPAPQEEKGGSKKKSKDIDF